MANDLTQDPLVIDTAAAGVALVKAPARIYGFKFVAAAAGNVQVTDAVTGHLIWEANVAITTTTPLDAVKLEVKGGVAVSVLTGGAGNRLYIYLGPPT